MKKFLEDCFNIKPLVVVGCVGLGSFLLFKINCYVSLLLRYLFMYSPTG